jgi:hypothetical protein
MREPPSEFTALACARMPARNRPPVCEINDCTDERAAFQLRRFAR